MLGIKVVELKREDVSQELAAKYFARRDGAPLDRFHLPELTAEVYDEYISVNAGPRTKDCNKQFATASNYYKEKVAKEIVAKDFGVSPSYVSYTDYVKDERFYEYYSTAEQLVHYLCPYHTPSVGRDTARVEYATSPVDVESFDRLWKFCTAVILQHKAMLFCKIEKTMQLLNRIIKDTHGLSTNASPKINASLKSAISFYKTLLEDKSFKETIASTTDIDVFAKDERTATDYIETYIKLYEYIGLDFTDTEEFQAFCPVSAVDLIKIEYRTFGLDQ